MNLMSTIGQGKCDIHGMPSHTGVKRFLDEADAQGTGAGSRSPLRLVQMSAIVNRCHLSPPRTRTFKRRLLPHGGMNRSDRTGALGTG